MTGTFFWDVFKFADPSPETYAHHSMHRIAPAEMDTTPETVEKRLRDLAMKFSPHCPPHCPHSP